MSAKPKKIKAILFDFMGVLLFSRADYKPDKIIDEIDRAIGEIIDDRLFKNETIKRYNLNEDGFNLILDRIIDKYEPFEPLWALLPAIRKRYKLAVVNNGTSLTLPKFKDKYHLDDIFDVFVSSAIEGVRKPDPRIYELATQKLGVKPEDCLFMDDSPENIDEASELGMATICWEDPHSGLKRFQEFIGANI